MSHISPSSVHPNDGHAELPYMLPPKEVYAALGSRPEGLTTAEATAQLGRVGPNAIREARATPLYRKFLANFTHLMAILLWVAGAGAFVARLPQLGIAVWLVVIINGLFSFWQEYKAEQATAALRKLLPVYAHVLRDGVEQRIPAEELVPGDVMLLAEGDAVSADGRLVQAAEMRVNQSTLSGEAHPVHKSALPVQGEGLARMEMPNLVFAGTSVAAGTGRAVVAATGMCTEFGRIAAMTQTMAAELSPLQREIEVATRRVSIVAVAFGVVVFVLAETMTGMGWAESFIFALGMIVAFVPEGMLPTVTLSLAMGVQRMARRHALVKRLSAVETLGCTTVICTDQTGTLTQNEMTVRALWTPSGEAAVTGTGYVPQGEVLQGDSPAPMPPGSDLYDLLLAATLCTNARLVPPRAEGERWSVLGDPTEAALLVAAAKAHLDLEAEARAQPRLGELPFESQRKRMASIHAAPDGGSVAYVKGAPRELLALCASVQLGGRVVELDEPLRQTIQAVNDEYARKGLRVLGVARRGLPPGAGESLGVTPADIECGLTFLGLCAMMDPPRPEIAAAVRTCHRAGIRIVMITGDYGLTAESIARRVGILRSAQPRIVTGAELESLDDTALQGALAGDVIFARVTPEHKLRVVAALQALGHVVAVTGDGVNDAPALKKADIGVAMGVAGSDVAKEAADMVLTDDNFASIVSAVEEGRAVYDNIRRFTSYILTSNFPEAVPFVLLAFSGGRIPLALNIMQVLAVDLGTDLAPALALGAEQPESDVMGRPPRSLSKHVIDGPLLRRAYLWQGPVQGLATMAAFYWMYWTAGYWGQWLDLPGSGPLYSMAITMAFAAVVMTQIGNLFAHRSEYGSSLRVPLRSNPLIWLGIAVELVLLCAMIYVSLFYPIFGMSPFPSQHWLFLLAWAPVLLIVDEARKAILRAVRRRASIRQETELHEQAGRA